MANELAGLKELEIKLSKLESKLATKTLRVICFAALIGVISSPVICRC